MESIRRAFASIAPILRNFIPSEVRLAQPCLPSGRAENLAIWPGDHVKWICKVDALLEILNVLFFFLFKMVLVFLMF